MRLPDFLGIGTQKGGTTSLHFLLGEDERIGLPQRKELHYFDQAEQKGKDHYAELFSGLEGKEIIGEVTPYYMFHPAAPKRIKDMIPDVKLIALLRDPVERTISQYFHAVRNGYEALSLVDAIMAEEQRLKEGSQYSHQKHSYVARSRYSEQLERYERHFRKTQILVMKSEELFKNTTSSWKQIESFLGLEEKRQVSRLPKSNSGKGEKKTVSQKDRKMIKERLNNEYEKIKLNYGIEWDK